jgi:Flp pilus assembly protein TadG
MIRKPAARRRRGSTLVECAFVYPITCFLIFGLLIGGTGIFRYQQVAHLAREAARFASVHGGQYAQNNAVAIMANELPNVDENYLRTSIVAGGAVAFDPSRLTTTVSMNTTQGSFAWDNTTATYNRWPYSTVIQNNKVIPVQNTVSVTVTYSWFPELYLVGPISLQSTAVMPMSY